MDYPTYLIHYGIPGQKWGNRRYQNEDGTWTQEGLERRRKEYIQETRDTIRKVAGIIAGHHEAENISQDEMKKLVNKYKKYEFTKNKDGEYSEKYKELVRKNNAHADSDGSKEGQKLHEWERFEELIYEDPHLLFWERSRRIDILKNNYHMTDEQAEKYDKYVDKIIYNYFNAAETFLNSSEVKKTLKELNIKSEEVWNREEEYNKGKKQGNRINQLSKTYDRQTLKPGSHRFYDPLSKYSDMDRRKSYEEYEKEWLNKIGNMPYKDVQDINKRMEEFRKKHGY